MLVFYEERLALLSVPKTGSTAYQVALRDRADLCVAGPPDLKHATVRRYDRFFQNMFRKMFDTEMEIMAVIREPVDWLGSWYRYRSRPELNGHPNSTRSITFDSFVNAYMQRDRPLFADVGSQAEFLLPRSNGKGATHVFKYDNQEGILSFLQDRLNCEISLTQENTSPSGDLSLNDQTLRHFQTHHAGEFIVYNAAL